MKELPKDIQSRIKQESQKKYPLFTPDYAGYEGLKKGRDGYISGATTEAVRAMPLVNYFKEIEDAIVNPHTTINQTLNQVSSITAKALSSYTGEQMPEMSAFEKVITSTVDGEQPKVKSALEKQNEEDRAISIIEQKVLYGEQPAQQPAVVSPDSDALASPPNFDQLVAMIEKLFRDYLEDVMEEPAKDIDKAWERYKILTKI